MTLAVLKQKLQTITGTSIGEVIFDWQEFLNEKRTKTYPVVLWSLGGAKFTEDKRSSVIQKTKTITLTVFAIASFNPESQDKITEWDTLESQFNTYLNKMDVNEGIQIVNISEIKGEYIPEGMISADSEIGIMFSEVTVKTFCS